MLNLLKQSVEEARKRLFNVLRQETTTYKNTPIQFKQLVGQLEKGIKSREEQLHNYGAGNIHAITGTHRSEGKEVKFNIMFINIKPSDIPEMLELCCIKNVITYKYEKVTAKKIYKVKDGTL